MATDRIQRAFADEKDLAVRVSNAYSMSAPTTLTAR